jgi:hypothetical protein
MCLVVLNLMRLASARDLAGNIVGLEVLADAGQVGGLARAAGEALEDDGLSALRKLLDFANDIWDLGSVDSGGNGPSSRDGDVGRQCCGRGNEGGGRGRHIGSDIGYRRRIERDRRSLDADSRYRRLESDSGGFDRREGGVGVDSVAVESRRQILSPVTHLENCSRVSTSDAGPNTEK